MLQCHFVPARLSHLRTSTLVIKEFVLYSVERIHPEQICLNYTSSHRLYCLETGALPTEGNEQSLLGVEVFFHSFFSNIRYQYGLGIAANCSDENNSRDGEHKFTFRHLDLFLFTVFSFTCQCLKQKRR